MCKICKIIGDRNECEEIKRKCDNCAYNAQCDYPWIYALWAAENKALGKDSLLGPAMPIFIKNDLRNNHIISITGKHDFCCFNVPKNKNVVVISDIYVDSSLRGQGISNKLLKYLMNTYDRDIFAKCVRGTSAEAFWQHVGVQINGNINNPEIDDLYEHRPNKRDLGWYQVINTNKKFNKESLF